MDAVASDIGVRGEFHFRIDDVGSGVVLADAAQARNGPL